MPRLVPENEVIHRVVFATQYPNDVYDDVYDTVYAF